MNAVGANLAGADLSGKNLTRVNLTGSDLSNANLSGTNLSSAHLSGANLQGANLSGANLTKSNLSKANLSGANLTGANLSAVALAYTDFSNSNLTKALFSGSIATGVNFRGADMAGATIGLTVTSSDFTQVNLQDANLSYVRFEKATSRSGGLRGTPSKVCSNCEWQIFGGYFVGSSLDASGLDLRGLTFTATSLTDAVFTNSDLRGVTFTAPSRGSAKVAPMQMSRIDMTGAQLQGSQFASVRLKDVNFTRADLSSANLSSASIDGPNWVGTNLSQASFTRASMSKPASKGIIGSPTSLPDHVTTTHRNDTGFSETRSPWALINGVFVGPRADMRGADLRGANLRGRSLEGGNLEGADLQGADLRSVNLSGTNLINANLASANLAKAKAVGGGYSGASFKDADLREADFFHINTRGLDLTGALLPPIKTIRVRQDVDGLTDVVCPVGTTLDYASVKWDFVPKGGYSAFSDAWFSYISRGSEPIAEGRGKRFNVFMVRKSRSASGAFDVIKETPYPAPVRATCGLDVKILFENKDKQMCPWGTECTAFPNQSFNSSLPSFGIGADTIYIGGQPYRYR